MPGTTTCRGYPYPVDADGIDIAGDLRRLAEALDVDLCQVLSGVFDSTPVGTIRATINSVADPGWRLMPSTVSNAVVNNPELWAMSPVAWRSGSDLNIPSMYDRALIGISAAGVLPGALLHANTRAIAAANLPLHQHSIDHDHGAINTGNTSIYHAHSGTTTGARNDHQHWFNPVGSSAVLQTFPGPNGINTQQGPGSTIQPNSQLTGGAYQDHDHNLNVNPADVVHSHTVDLPNYAGSSGNGGFANTPYDVRQAAMSAVFQIKVSK